MAVLLASHSVDASYIVDAPFILGEMTTGLFLPKTGDGTWYLAVRPGVVIDVPIRKITWDGDAFAFDAELRAGGLGATMRVSGTVAADGALSARVEPASGRGISPFGALTGERVVAPRH
jgi:hypothetical protein